MNSSSNGEVNGPFTGMPDPAPYVLRLFVSGNTPRSHQAITRLHDLCETHLHGRCSYEVVDISRQGSLARAEQIVATPTLVKYSPKPRKVWVGDLSNTERILASLGEPQI